MAPPNDPSSTTPPPPVIRLGDGSDSPIATVASAGKTQAQLDAEKAAQAAVSTTGPGQGGWVPPAWAPIATGVGGAGFMAVADVVTHACPVGAACVLPPWQILLAALVKGIVVGAVGYFGTKSAGPRAPGQS